MQLPLLRDTAESVASQSRPIPEQRFTIGLACSTIFGRPERKPHQNPKEPIHERVAM